MADHIDAFGVFMMLREACKEAGGQEAFARLHGISKKTVNGAMTGRRIPPEPSILSALGLRRVTYYVEIEK